MSPMEYGPGIGLARFSVADLTLVEQSRWTKFLRHWFRMSARSPNVIVGSACADKTPSWANSSSWSSAPGTRGAFPNTH